MSEPDMDETYDEFEGDDLICPSCDDEDCTGECSEDEGEGEA